MTRRATLGIHGLVIRCLELAGEGRRSPLDDVLRAVAIGCTGIARLARGPGLPQACEVSALVQNIHFAWTGMAMLVVLCIAVAVGLAISTR